MNEELEKIDTTVREPPKKQARAGKIHLSSYTWAKAVAYVLMLLFFIVLVAGVFELFMFYEEYYRYDTAELFVSSSHIEQHDNLSLDDIVFARRLMMFMYNLGSWAIPLIIVGAVGMFACIVFLLCGAGRRPGREDVRMIVLDKIPLDLYLCICIAIAVLGVFAYAYGMIPITASIFVLSSEGVIFAVSSCVVWYILLVICLLPFLSLATRVKAGGGIWWRKTVIYWVCSHCWRAVKWCWNWLWSLVKRFCGWIWYMTRKIPIVPRTVIIALAVIIVETLICCSAFAYYYSDGIFILFWVAFNAALFIAICFGAWQMKSLKAAGERMARGEIDKKIDTQHMYWEFKRHAENLNSIGDGMAAAVEQRMKSERLKTELITNVSHDIKTPLTSIVNYVDLLQKPHTPEQEAEYLEVLDRQSKRLKKLTEDLVEASKASTGNMNVNIVRTNTREIIEQSLAEYGRRMEQGNLAVIVNIPDEPPHAMADGRLLWRVLDNLFNNVVKYAMSNTRVYIDAAADGGEVIISVKNISRDPLNISADELMERFVRGDSSRHTEGSGLGLNIVQSLVTLMHGTFSISIDGDLFKAEIRLPEAK